MTQKLYIFLISGEYNKFHRRSFIENFAKYVYPSNVIIINRPKDLIATPLKKSFKLKQKKLYQVQKNILLYTPFIFIHEQLIINQSLFLRKKNMFLFNNEFKKIISSFSYDSLILFNMHPDLNDYLKFIDYDKLVYDMYDEFIVKDAIKNIEIREEKLLKMSDIALSVSLYLKQKKISKYDINKISHIKNAVDIELFKSTRIKKTDKKIVGYLGNIKNEIDIDLIYFLASKRPDIEFQIIGKLPDSKYIDFFSNLENVVFLGGKKYEELPDIVSTFHIGLIPYKTDNEYIKSISPMKLYEYLACDLYVLSTPIPDVIETKNTIVGSNIEIANNYNEFLDKMNYLLTLNKNILSYEQLYSISWKNRFEDLFKEFAKREII